MHIVKWNRSRACDNMWCKSVSSSSDCVQHVMYVSVGVVHKNMPYDGVQVYIRNNSSVCTSAGDCVSACSCIMRELKIVNTTSCHCKRS